MATRQLFVTDGFAFRNESAADDGRLEESSTTGTGLRLAVDNWAFLAETNMAGFTTLMFLTIKHSSAVEFARVIGRNWRIPVRTTWFVT